MVNRSRLVKILDVFMDDVFPVTVLVAFVLYWILLACGLDLFNPVIWETP